MKVKWSTGGSRIPRKRWRQPSRGAPTYDFAKISKKLHEIWKILGRGGRTPRLVPWIRHWWSNFITSLKLYELCNVARNKWNLRWQHRTYTWLRKRKFLIFGIIPHKVFCLCNKHFSIITFKLYSKVPNAGSEIYCEWLQIVEPHIWFALRGVYGDKLWNYFELHLSVKAAAPAGLTCVCTTELTTFKSVILRHCLPKPVSIWS